MINSVVQVVLNVLSFVLGIGYAQNNFFNTTLPNIVTFSNTYMPQFKVYLSYLFYFVPKGIVVTLCTYILAITIARIILAIVKLIWW